MSLISRPRRRLASSHYDDRPHDPHANATIGYGHKLHSGPVTKHDLDEWKGGISDSRAESIFDTDLRVAVHAVTDQVEMPLTQNQFDALVDLAFNIGYGNFGHLSVRELLNEGDYLQAGENIRYVSGNSGRRSDESRLFAAR